MSYCRWCGTKIKEKLYCSKSCTQKYHHNERKNKEEILKPIPCLSCHKSFKSGGIHNRICNPCKGANRGKEDINIGYGFGVNSKSGRIR